MNSVGIMTAYLELPEYAYLVNSNGVSRRYKLIEVKKEDLFNLRMSSKPVLIVKDYGQYYYSYIPANTKVLFKDLAIHKCANCKRLNARSDEEGGCAKVRDLDLKDMKPAIAPLKEQYPDAMCIENYPFIEYGFETVNVVQESFIVFYCKNFNMLNKNFHSKC